jgi:hypothetical protein
MSPWQRTDEEIAKDKAVKEVLLAKEGALAVKEGLVLPGILDWLLPWRAYAWQQTAVHIIATMASDRIALLSKKHSVKGGATHHRK